ncbi:RNA polymerase sigma factor [Rhodococcus sp. H29-C3]|uniref:RNA polymerase sigma factor n=1 Tax=Rhodococcus sp. H29-C3 TaxID=3046307 RepID=UPI0024B969A9|nr:RNA polymerase sigma factor [Rhodococcus sp. H29-C3]MDJ0361176.1 RNA polymerase sigma factor [Rhodococcus sp. H29-C3]
MSHRSAFSLEAVFREEYGQLLATLVGRFGDLDLAEDATSDALEAALSRWPVDGVPSRPGAWLLTTARRRAVDRLRRDQAYAAKLAVLQVEQDRAFLSPVSGPVDGGLPDERLQLFFTCAHPALAPDDRIAITLRTLAGLTTTEVARAFLIPSSTAGQRISRAKHKIRVARIPFRVPDRHEMAQRLPGVLQVVYSIFTEGYSASSGENLIRTDLAEEAIRLGRILHGLLPAEREATGLLSLMLCTHARRSARAGKDGEIVMLGEQDRRLWDREMIDEGRALVVLALTGGSPGPYGVQAAIAALHDEAIDAESTDWPQIAELYGVLATIAPSPIVSLNRAAAIALCEGPGAGLELMEALSTEPLLKNYYPYLCARADLLARLDRWLEAARWFECAFGLAGSEPEKKFVQRRLSACYRNASSAPEDTLEV